MSELYNEGMPRVSHDGKLVAYVTNRTGHDEVYVRKLRPGSEEVKVSAESGVDPAWSADGREMLYRGPDSMMVAQVSHTSRLAVTGRQSLFSLTSDYTLRTRTVYAVFPDGRRFAMLALRSATIRQRNPPVVRLNCASGFGTSANDRKR